MANVFLDSTDTNYEIGNNNTKVFGATGSQKVTLKAGVTGVTLDANVEGVVFVGATTDYKFKQVGAGVEIYAADGTTLIAKTGSVEATVPLTFANGTVDAKVGASGLTIGGTVITATAAAVVPATIDASVASAPIPVFSVAGAASATEGGNALFTVTLANPSATTPTTVKYALSNVGTTTSADYGTAVTSGTNVTEAAGTLTFAAGATTATITVPVTFDSIVEAGEGITLTLSTPSVGQISSTGAAVTTTFADAPAPTFVMTSSAVAGISTQEGSTITFTVTPTGIVNAQTVLNLNMVGSALGAISATTSAADFTSPSSIIFAAGDTAAKTVTVTVVADGATEGIEAYKAQLLDSSFAEKAAIQGTVADQTPTVTLAAAATTVNEGAALVFTATSDMAAPAGGLVVPVTFAGTATAADYTTTATSITIAAGATTGTLTLNAIADNLTEGAETVTATLGNVNGATTVTTPVSVTINDTSLALAANAFSLSGAATANEGTSVVYTITRGAAATVATTVPYTITGTATSGSDYTAQTGTASFAIGATTATITLPITADTLTEGSETVIVTLGTPSVATDIVTAGAGTVTTTIADTSTSPVLNTFSLTTSIDNVGSTYNSVSGVIDQVGTIAANTTWTVSDTIAPAAGSSASLNLLTKNGTTTAGLNSSGVTTLTVRSTDQTDGADSYGLNLAGFTGLTKVSVANSSVINTTAGINDTFTLSSLPAGMTLDLNTNGASQSVTATGTDWSGLSDTLAVSVAGRNGTVTLGSSTNGIETVALSTSGTTARLASLVSGTSTATNKTVTVAGSGLKIDGVMDSTITSFDASSSNGNVNVYLAPGTVLTSAKAGSGTADTLAVNTLPATLATITGFERLQVEASGTYSLTNAATVTTLIVDATTSTTIAPDFTNATATQNTILVSGAEQRTTAANTTNNLATGAISYALTTSTGTADALALTLNNGGVASTSTTVGTLTLGGLTANAIENITINAADFKTITLGNLTAAPSGAAALTVTVPATSSNLVLGTLAITHGSSATTADVINLSAVTGTTSATLTGTVGTLSLTGGTGVDTISLNSDIAASSRQTYNLGAGNDAFTVSAAQTTGNAGTLVINTEAGDDSITLSAAVPTGTNFSVNGGDGIDTIKTDSNSAVTIIDSLVGVEKLFSIGSGTTTIAGSSTAANNSIEITQIGTGVTAFTTTAAQAVSIAGVTAVGTVNNTLLTLTGLTGAETLTGSSTVGTAISGAGANDTIIGGSGADSITGGAGADSIAVGLGVDKVIQAATGDSGTFTRGATATNSASTAGLDVITGLKASDIIALSQYTSVGTVADNVLVTAKLAVVDNVDTTNGTALTDNAWTIVHGTYTSSTNTFVGATYNVSTAADMLLIYDGNQASGTTAAEAIVLVGAGALSVAASGAGLLTFA